MAAAELWDLLGKMSTLAQLSGLHTLMLVAVVMRLLRIQKSRRECAKLERCLHMLRALLLECPATGCGAVLQRSGMWESVGRAIDDAAGLVDDYRRSTLWRRVRCGRAMAARLRQTREIVSCYSVLVLVINGNLLTYSDTTATCALR